MTTKLHLCTCQVTLRLFLASIFQENHRSSYNLSEHWIYLLNLLYT